MADSTGNDVMIGEVFRGLMRIEKKLEEFVTQAEYKVALEAQKIATDTVLERIRDLEESGRTRGKIALTALATGLVSLLGSLLLLKIGH